MNTFNIRESGPETWESGYQGVIEARKDSHSRDLTKIRIETDDEFEIAAHSRGQIILGSCAIMHWVYKEHIPGLVQRDLKIVRRYMIPLESEDPRVERFWFNNRSYLKVHGQDEGPYPLIDEAIVDIRPRN